MKKQLALSMLVALAACTTWYVATAQESRSRPVSQVPRSFSSPTPSTESNPFNPAFASPADPSESSLDPLHQELIRLTEAAASMMDEEELEIEVERARQRATVMAANQRLEEIRAQLREIIENCPGTEASATASAMLAIDIRDAIDTVPAEGSEDSGEAASIPDDAFDDVSEATEEAAEGSVDIDVDFGR